VQRILRGDLWALIGALLLAAGLPYLSAALGWAATQDESSITMRADVAAGILIALLGFTILAIVFIARAWTLVRRRPTAKRLAR
jgi:hypothetical protein